MLIALLAIKKNKLKIKMTILIPKNITLLLGEKKIIK